jgi:general secretion pathway protein E
MTAAPPLDNAPEHPQPVRVLDPGELAPPPSIGAWAEPHTQAATDRVTFDVPFIAKLLVEAGVITEETRRDMTIQEPTARARLIQKRRAQLRDPRRVRTVVHPVEVLLAAEPKLAADPTIPLTEVHIFQVVADVAGLPFIKIDPLSLSAEKVIGTFSRPFATRYNVLTLDTAPGLLKLAVANPWDSELFEHIRRIHPGEIDVVIASREDISRTINEFYGFRQSVESAQRLFRTGTDIGNLEQYVKLRAVEELEATDRHVVKAVEYLLRYAFEQRASDIHVEPKRDHSLIRLRIDGVLHDVHVMPKPVHPPFVSRIKMLARLDIAEKRKPQDGRIKTGTENHEVELRISTLPTAFGEKVVIRIFDPEVLAQDLDDLGFYPRERSLFEKFIAEPNGLILVTGPTGSGKTTTLYSSLRMLASPEINITTIEDPIEIVFEELNQTAIHPRIGITFASALKHILRQDPDVIMVGEIRDPETAENAIQAALTGHLVLSTLHTNDAATAITRMTELGVKPFLLASTLLGVVAQRLVRKICPACSTETVLTPEQVLALDIQIPEGHSGRLPVQIGAGCPECRGTGYRGRVGVFEVLEINHKVRKLIREGSDSNEITRIARLDGMKTLRECAVNQLADGTTTFDEVVRVTTGRE